MWPGTERMAVVTHGRKGKRPAEGILKGLADNSRFLAHGPQQALLFGRKPVQYLISGGKMTT